MDQPLFGIPDMDLYLVMGILAFFIIIEIVGGYLHQTKRKFGDWFLEAGSYFILGLIIKPVIVFTGLAICNQLIPSANYILINQPFLLALLLFLLVDDFLQYWYHRSAHEYLSLIHI